jgi:hypothetical protein
MPDIPMNAECQDCPLRGKENPCTRIMGEWKRRGSIRRPEVVVLLFKMLAAHPEAHCHTLTPDITEIEQRPDMRPRKRAIADEKKPEVVQTPPAETAKKVPEIMVGRMPRHRFSLREGK